jgi:chemotaxis protein MotB
VTSPVGPCGGAARRSPLSAPLRGAARSACLALAALGLSGCVVLSSTYDAEVARGKELEKRVAERDAELAKLRGELSDSRKQSENLEVARESLSREQLALQERYEDLRIDRETLEQQLEAERVSRAQADTQVKELSGSYTNLVEELEEEVASGKIEIQKLRGQLQVRALDRILFASGSAELKPDGRTVLKKLAAQILKLDDQRVRVEGHTDDVPIATAKFPSNWELSAARAAQVVRAFEEAGMDPKRLEAIGFGPNRPIEDNATPEGRSRNRRIEIVLVPVSE